MEQDRFFRSFMSFYLYGKAENDMKEEDIAKALGYKSRATLKAKRDNPMTFTLGDLLKLTSLFGGGVDDLVLLLRGTEH